jgi:hypothetical protein
MSPPGSQPARGRHSAHVRRDPTAPASAATTPQPPPPVPQYHMQRHVNCKAGLSGQPAGAARLLVAALPHPWLASARVKTCCSSSASPAAVVSAGCSTRCPPPASALLYSWWKRTVRPSLDSVPRLPGCREGGGGLSAALWGQLVQHTDQAGRDASCAGGQSLGGFDAGAVWVPAATHTHTTAARPQLGGSCPARAAHT